MHFSMSPNSRSVIVRQCLTIYDIAFEATGIGGRE